MIYLNFINFGLARKLFFNWLYITYDIFIFCSNLSCNIEGLSWKLQNAVRLLAMDWHEMYVHVL